MERQDALKTTAERRSHTSYLDETYMEITRWTAETQIQYRPHAKREGTKSFVRYEKYMHAKTVGEALELGSFPADWCWDWERGFIKVVGGKIRDQPLNPMDKYKDENLTEVDKIVMQWFKREAARKLGVSIKELSQDKNACESLLMRMLRSMADKTAKSIIAECEASGRKVTEQDVLKVLQDWAFRHNETRLNVMPEGQKFVFSDTLGLIPSRDGRIMATKYTLEYPGVITLLCRYLKDLMPEEIGREGFPFTSINVNKNYAARLHRDGNNVGPSMIKALGNFTGGRLNYWPDDDKSKPLEELPEDGKVSLDLHSKIAIFDGRRGHSVDDFKGDRFSLVWFSCPRSWKAEDDLKVLLKSCGVTFPTPELKEKSLEFLTPPRGYAPGLGKPAGAQYKAWPVQVAPERAVATPTKAARRVAEASPGEKRSRPVEATVEDVPASKRAEVAA